MALTAIRAGQAVQIIWSVTQSYPTPAQPYDPPSPPTITIFDPLGDIQINNVATTRLATGVYSYIYITSSNSTLGIWNAWLNVVDANSVPSGSVDQIDSSKATPVFQLV